MGQDEHEMLIEYSEMTAFNFNSKEYKEVKKDFIECKEVAPGIEWLMKNFISKLKKEQTV